MLELLSSKTGHLRSAPTISIQFVPSAYLNNSSHPPRGVIRNACSWDLVRVHLMFKWEVFPK